MSARNLTWGLCLLFAVLGGACGGTGSALGAEASGADTEQIDVIMVDEPARELPAELTIRARITALNPPKPTTIQWRYGGEAQGGDVISGALGQGLRIGEWTEPVSLTSLTKGRFPPRYHARVWFITFTVAAEKARGLEMEFEFSYKGKVIKSFKEAGPDGSTVGVAVPHYRLSGGKDVTDPDFIRELRGLLEYALERAERLEKLPWGDWPVPKLLPIMTDISGFGDRGYGVRYSNKAITEAECRALRQLGINSLRAAPRFLMDMADKREGFGKPFGRARITHAMGFAVPRYRRGRPHHPEAGCPFGSPVPELTTAGVLSSLEHNLEIEVDEAWALTVDEIGTVLDGTPEGKQHLNVCPRCRGAFQTYVKTLGATPDDFGVKDWDSVRPFWPGGDGEPGPPAQQYYSRKFNNYLSAKMFSALRNAFDRANEQKQRALRRGETDTPAAKQPWIYSYALRGNTFLMKGHSLDFFDFYRYADNAFVYETSNRGAQIWGWDSYLCDVGRVVSAKMKKRFGIYVKPHRGAPLQRALSAISRNVKMLYWYTYGPEYFKGDSFADRWDALEVTSKAAHLIGKTEKVLYGSSWVAPAEVAIVKPRTTEFLRTNAGNAAWENAKWVYTALTHAHIPVDPLDEVMLETEDLSRYKVIYVNGSHITKAAAEKLAQWVQAGGTLWTSGWGCARDQADKPLTALEPVLGLTGRNEPELWYRVQRYGGGGVQSFGEDRYVISPLVQKGAKITGSGAFKSSFIPVIGREVLKPGPGTEVFATFADGGVAATRHKYGEGQAYVVGFFPGLEYSAPVRTARFNMARDFDAGRRSFVTAPALSMVKPVVDASQPTVEGLLLKNDKSGARAVTLMNWAYRVSALRQYPNGRKRPVISIAPHKNLKVSIRGAGDVSKVTSAMLDKSLPIEKVGDLITVVLPEVQEGDVLLLE